MIKRCRRFCASIVIAGIVHCCAYHDVGQPPCLPAAPGIAVIPESDCFSEDGSIVLEVTDASYRYSFQLDAPVDKPEFTHLAAGSYYIEIIDKNDCRTWLQVDVPRTLPNVTWSQDVRPIIETRCSKAACHGGSNRVLFGSYETVKLHAQQIKVQVSMRSMPQDGQLTDDEIKKIVCWVESGAPEN